MSNTVIATLGSSLLLVLLITALAFKLRKWVKNLSSELAVVRKELLALKTSIVDPDSHLSKTINNAALESVNATCLAPLGLKFPVFLGGWSIDTFLGRWLIQHILETRPKCIVELGSGSSTILIARALDLIGAGEVTHIAVDHEKKYLDLTHNLAELNGIAERIEFLHCPLIFEEKYGKQWYSELEKRTAGLKIDLLLIDGPPGPLQPMSRLPAFQALMPFMNETCVVVLDDANRADEQLIAEQWVRENPSFQLHYQKEGHGVAILSRRSSPSNTI